MSSVAGGSFEVRSGSPAGALLATVAVPATGGIYQYGTATARLSGATGVRDLYLVFKGDLRIKDLTLTK